MISTIWKSKIPTNFWKTIGKIGVGNERQKNIPLEVKVNGRITRDKVTVLKKWKDSFQSL